jgi:hypothetical protein
MNVRNWCLTKERDNCDNDSINDWRNFDFNKIKTLSFMNIGMSTIENQSFIDFGNLDKLDLSGNKLTKKDSNFYYRFIQSKNFKFSRKSNKTSGFKGISRFG